MISEDDIGKTLEHLSQIKLSPKNKAEIWSIVESRLIRANRVSPRKHRQNVIGSAAAIVAAFGVIAGGSMIGLISSLHHTSSIANTTAVSSYISQSGEHDTKGAAPTHADVMEAVSAVRKLNDAIFSGDWRAMPGLVYNTSPKPIPSGWFKTEFTKYPTAYQKFVIGTPYVVKNWATPAFLASLNSDTPNPHLYSDKFRYAIVVPVFYGKGNSNHPILLHCVRNSNGKWQVAYNQFKGYE